MLLLSFSDSRTFCIRNLCNVLGFKILQGYSILENVILANLKDERILRDFHLSQGFFRCHLIVFEIVMHVTQNFILFVPVNFHTHWAVVSWISLYHFRPASSIPASHFMLLEPFSCDGGIFPFFEALSIVTSVL